MSNEIVKVGNVAITWNGQEKNGARPIWKATVAGHPVAFTVSEMVVLEYLMRRQGMLVTQAALSEYLYDGAPIAATSNVIEVMVSRIRRKLKAANADIGIRTLRSRGYMLVEEDTV